MAIERVKMPEQDAAERRSANFEEVNLGLTPRAAPCARPSAACSARTGRASTAARSSVASPTSSTRVAERRLRRRRRDPAAPTTPCPAISGRVCPQETQCEGVCIRGKKGEPVAIGCLERFVADWAAANMAARRRPPPRRRGKQGGRRRLRPGGLTAAGELARMGHDVHRLRGPARPRRRAALRHPRVPPAQGDRRRTRSTNLRRLGVEIECNVVVGRDAHRRRAARSELRRRLHRQRRRPADVPEHPRREPQGRLLGQRVPHARQPDGRLRRPARRHARSPAARRWSWSAAATWPWTPCARPSAWAPSGPSCVYRRSRGRDAGPRRGDRTTPRKRASSSSSSWRPLEILGDEKGWVRAVELQRMELGEPDASGRRRPVPVAGQRVRAALRRSSIVAIGTRGQPAADQRHARTSSSTSGATSWSTRTA